jgi:hypothetical protein
MTQPSQREVSQDGEGGAWYKHNCQRSPEKREQWQEQDRLAHLWTGAAFVQNAVTVQLTDRQREPRLRDCTGCSVDRVDGTYGYSRFLPIPDGSVDMLISGFGH